MNLYLRPIELEDAAALAAVIVAVIQEFACPDSEYLQDTPELSNLFEDYQGPGKRYWVVVEQGSGKLMGGGGYAPLEGSSPSARICELQKLYLLPEIRGKGIGQQLVDKILESAQQEGFQEIYLECIPELKQAIGLYEKYGFHYLNQRKGDTGHPSCSVYMSRSLMQGIS